MKHLSDTNLLGQKGWATFSDCGRYRFTLGRVWSEGPLCNGLFMNPSTADHLELDPTTKRFRTRCQTLGYGGMIVTNINAFIETKQNEIRTVEDPTGEGNDEAIIETASQCDIVVCAWGANQWSADRARHVFRMIHDYCPQKIHCLQTTAQGHPQHPLYIAYKVQPTRFFGEIYR